MLVEGTLLDSMSKKDNDINMFAIFLSASINNQVLVNRNYCTDLSDKTT